VMEAGKLLDLCGMLPESRRDPWSCILLGIELDVLGQSP
jgi:hypothetical protein